jgi:8-oxo-dGTP pyrophosphatase MutT (NUDIX family)
MDSDERAAIRAEVVEHAEEVLAGIEDRWGEFTRLEPLEVVPLPHNDDTFPESTEAFFDEFYSYASGAVVTDDDGRLLCVYSPARDEWETPGGAGDPGETPAETARRETVEETGVECEITGVLHGRLMEIDLGEPETLPIPVATFTGRPVGGEELAGEEIEDHGEITDLAWFGPEELPEIREYEGKYEYLTSLPANR